MNFDSNDIVSTDIVPHICHQNVHHKTELFNVNIYVDMYIYIFRFEMQPFLYKLCLVCLYIILEYICIAL